MRRISLFVIAMAMAMMASAQAGAVGSDTATVANDSLLQSLRSRVQELEMQRILMMEQVETSGRTAREDSMRQAARKARIDSLRAHTEGAPVVVEGDTLFIIYARSGGMLPAVRAKEAAESITEVGHRLKVFPDSIYVFEGDFTSDIMAGDQIIVSLNDNDALWQNTTRQQLAADYSLIVGRSIVQLHERYGLQQKLKGLVLVVVIIVLQILLIRLTNWLYRRWRIHLTRKLLRQARPISIKDYEVLNVHRQGILFLTGFNIVRWAAILLQLFFSIPLLFSAFPETKALTYRVFGYVWNPFVDILGGILGFLPNLFKIVVIVVCFRYLVKGFHYLLNEIAVGNLKINGFYADWAQPTFVIVRLLCYSFMFVMIWPLLPSSNSEVFQGVSVFIGVIVSLGSSSIIGNVMAGMVMTYMRPFRIGDFIKFGDTEGFVIEKTVLVTRIRTRKNEVITIPNSNLMTSQTSNFTFAAQNYGVIVHTKVTIGYDMKWEMIRDLLLTSARATPHIVKKPEPYVRITALDDFYVEYEINAYTHKPEALSEIYSALHQNILDNFHTNGVEIMSPHIIAQRSDLELQIPKSQQKQE
ncbi:MAG: mechanosensitive ion channel family protein [Prevotella sp.]|nr:mechanosensitive ion channel family protein [Prevotella sp.]